MIVRSESDAFRTVFAVAALAAVSVLVGVLVHPVAGLACFVLLGALALAWAAHAEERGPTTLQEAIRQGRSTHGGHRVLVIANEALGGPVVHDELCARRDRAPAQAPLAVEVLAPVLQSRTHYVTTDIDRETAEARERLERTLAWARANGISATGQVGDPIDPLAGVIDELQRFEIDEVIVAGHRPEHSGWLEHDLVSRLRSELDVPVAEITVEPEPIRHRAGPGGE